jgi:hypothetical protein
MKKKYYVDIPNPELSTVVNWVNVASFSTKKACEKFLKEKWGISKKYSSLFISEVLE